MLGLTYQAVTGICRASGKKGQLCTGKTESCRWSRTGLQAEGCFGANPHTGDGFCSKVWRHRGRHDAGPSSGRLTTSSVAKFPADSSECRVDLLERGTVTIHHLATYVNETTVASTMERFGLPVATVVQTKSDSWLVLLAHQFGFLGEKRPDDGPTSVLTPPAWPSSGGAKTATA